MAQEPGKVADHPTSAAHSTDTAPRPLPSTSEIRSQIELTRAEMSETIDAIQDRLSPSRLVTDAKEAVKDATVGRVKRLAARSTSGSDDDEGRPFDATRVLEVIRGNPIPVALIGLAATFLTARALSGSGNGARRRSEEYEAARSEHAPAVAHRVGSQPRRLVFGGACAGLACWTAWRNAQRSAPSLSRASGPDFGTGDMRQVEPSPRA